MAKKTHKPVSVPGEEAVLAERKRLAYMKKFRTVLMSTVYVLIVVAAVSVLLATLFLPVLQVSGSSMEPTLSDRDIILLFKGESFETGDLVGFYFQNKLLLKRVIGGPGDIIDIEPDGTVYVNNVKIDEPYVTDRALGECDLDFPYQVPENRYFLMGDNRSTSIDSRTSAVGCIEVDQIVGKVVVRVWPLNQIKFM
ncbi:MAG: signal peptidase I [Clostridiales bacterium]|nr:signal peptidase I [Clostridiales bacterium]